jgi:cbb3-type cytochrome oxidase cytochrome c subunit
MNYAPLIFLAAFFALASSWFGMVLGPQLQVGRLNQTNTVPDGVVYPVSRPGLARQGLDVYRANGCAACHSEQVRQSGTVCDVILAEAGTNQTKMVTALQNVRTNWSKAEAEQFLANLPKPVLEGIGRDEADQAYALLGAAGAKVEMWIIPIGPDIARGWGKRRGVAEDFLYDYPVMSGSQRIGPDLANVGVRLPDPNWQLVHLYAPRLEVKGSAMPPYRFLFEKRKVGREASPDALQHPKLSVESGFEIVPKPEAKALVAYLGSLHAIEPLYETPLTVPATPAPSTNAPAASAATNAAPTNVPAK